MATLQEYKCPCCGGAIAFDSSIQKMKCPYCDTEFEMDTLAQYDAALSADNQDSMNWNCDQVPSWQAGEDENMRVYVCNSCGGQIVGDANMAACSCPYCDNPIVVMGQLAGDLKPEYIIPFKLDKKAAKENFAKHLKGKRFLPKVFKSENHIDEIKGIYVPYWLFDSNAIANVRYRATSVRHYSDSSYNYTETKYFAVFRSGDIAFSRVPVDGSSKMPDDLMESIEPYNFNEAVPFQTAYFAGYLADRYDVDANTSSARANERVRNSTQESFRKTVQGYSSVIPEGGNITLSEGKTSYAMYPVWIMNTTWKGEKYIFAMNGQTGKFVGNLPVDKGIAAKYLWGLTAAFSAGIFAVLSLIWLF